MTKKGTKKFRICCLLIPLSIVISGLTILGYQSFFWLKLGHWKPIASRLLLDKVLPINFFQWLHSPYTWTGLKKLILPIVDLPLAMLLLLVGLISLLMVVRIFNLFSKPEKVEVFDRRRWRTT